LEAAFSVLLEKEFSPSEVESILDLGVGSLAGRDSMPDFKNLEFGNEDEFDSIVEDAIAEEDILSAADYQDEIEVGQLSHEELVANFRVRKREISELLSSISSAEIESYLYAIDLLLACRRTSVRLSTDGWANVARDLF